MVVQNQLLLGVNQHWGLKQEGQLRQVVVIFYVDDVRKILKIICGKKEKNIRNKKKVRNLRYDLLRKKHKNYTLVKILLSVD